MALGRVLVGVFASFEAAADGHVVDDRSGARFPALTPHSRVPLIEIPQDPGFAALRGS